MTKNLFNFCDHDTTKASNLQLTRNIISCANCGSKSRKLGAGRQAREASLLCEKVIEWASGSGLEAIASQLKGGQR